MLKGHAKIELFDALTGKKKEELHEDNLVTNAAQYAMALAGRMGHSLTNEIIPIPKQALGGLLLFDNTLEENVENVVFPGSAHLVGFADRTTNTSNPMRGSLNTLETKMTDTGYVSVWDFSTSQANGTIKSIALTNVKAAQNPILYQANNDIYCFSLYENDDVGNSRPVYLTDEYLYWVDCNTKKVMRAPLRPYKLHVSDGSFIDYRYMHDEVGDLPLPNLTVIAKALDKGMVVPDNQGNFYIITMNHRTYKSGSYTYYYYNEGNSSGDATLYVTKYHITDGKTASVEKVDEGSLVTLSGVHLASVTSQPPKVAGHYLYMTDYPQQCIFIINLDNLADLRKITIVTDLTNAVTLKSGMYQGGVCYQAARKNNSSLYYYGGILYEDGTMVESPDPGSQSSISNYFLRDGKTAAVEYDTYGYTSAFRILMAGCYLGTINNLQTPVKKTASQTMKITYTLTDASAQEA